MPELEMIEAGVLQVLGEVLKQTPDDLRAQPVLAVHDWDSMASLEALSQLESRFAVTLDLRTYHAARTVEDLTGLVVAAGAGEPTADRR